MSGGGPVKKSGPSVVMEGPRVEMLRKESIKARQ
jgi:hypothetical protein